MALKEFIKHFLFGTCVSFGVSELEFLGHHLTNNEITPLPAKVQVLIDFPPPMSKRALRRFLELVNYYRRFVLNCAALLQSLEMLLRESRSPTAPLVWQEGAQRAPEEIKYALASAILLVHPAPGAPTYLTPDAASALVGANAPTAR